MATSTNRIPPIQCLLTFEALARLFDRAVPSPHAHYLCWRTGVMDRWECAAFVQWLQKSIGATAQ